MDLVDAAPQWRIRPRRSRPQRLALSRPKVPAATTPSPTPTGLTAADRHLLRRFSAGLTPSLATQALAAGGARAWFEQQLAGSALTDPRGDEIDAWFDFHDRTPQEFFKRFQDGTEGFWVVMPNLARWTVARRLESSRQLHEIMVDFWSNHLNVPLSKEEATFARVDYDKVIRANALGTFEQLLQSAITHPAMVVSLSNNTSTKTAPNENLGRELMELHTVGVDGGYTETDVKNSARILTGYRVDVWNGFTVKYDTSWHDTNPVKVMDFTSSNSSPDGRAVTMSYLSYLARHPKTARRIARKLCVRFVRDDPSESLVTAVTSAYLANGTAIKPTLRALVDHPDFATSVRAKLRTPQEDWQATVRSLGITLQKKQSDNSFVNAMYWQFDALGSSPYDWPSPDGYPDANGAWASAGRMMNSFTVHRSLTNHWWPSADAGLPALTSLLPTMPATLQQVIDTVSTTVVGEPAGPDVSDAIATALGWSLARPVSATEARSFWTLPTIVGSLLDSPLHLYR